MARWGIEACMAPEVVPGVYCMSCFGSAMVTSDARECPQETKEEWEVPRVSPYRLAAHLTSAAIIYGTLLWTSLSLAFPTSAAAAVSSDVAMTAGVNVLRRWAHPVAGLIAITALSGVLPADSL